MQKIITGLLLAVMMLSSSGVFAQFQSSSKISKNIKNLDKVLVNYTHRKSLSGLSRYYRPIRIFETQECIRVHVSENEYTRLSTTLISRKVQQTPAAEDLIRYHHAVWVEDRIKVDKIFETHWLCVGGKGAYTDQAELARSTHAFYKGIIEPKQYVGPDGHLVHIYFLPVHGILYQPVGYKMPVMLDPNEYLVVYDLETNTGKIINNSRGVYNLFKLQESK